MASHVKVSAPASGWLSMNSAAATPSNSTAFPTGESMTLGWPTTVVLWPPMFSSRSKAHTSILSGGGDCASGAPPSASAVTKRWTRCRFLMNLTLQALPPRGELPLDRCASRRKVSQRVGIVNLPQHVVRKADPVDSAAAVQRGAGGGAKLRRVIEVLVVGLEEPPVRHPELLDPAVRTPVGPEEDAVLILEEERADHQ